MKPDWSPFKLTPAGEYAPAPRSIDSPEGVTDRLRAAAFAEIQAREAFNWAASRFEDAPEALRAAWRGLALAEDKHLNWLLARMRELGVEAADRPVSDHLWESFMKCETARDFAIYMANAEERGRKAGERFAQALAKTDTESARIFGQIALEEVAHIELAHRYFPVLPNPLAPRSDTPSSTASIG